MGNYSSVLIPDTEEFESIVSLVAEKPNDPRSLLSELQTLVNMEMERVENHCEDQTPTQETNDALSFAALKMNPSASSSGQSFSSLLPKALCAVLHPTTPPGHSPDHPEPSKNSTTHTSPPNLQQLQTELTVLRGQFEQMKTQHNKEIKLLMNELDEEKRIRLTLQMEIQRIKKHMSK